MSVLISFIQHLGLEVERQPLHSNLKINNFTSAVIFHPHAVVTNVHTSWGGEAGWGWGVSACRAVVGRRGEYFLLINMTVTMESPSFGYSLYIS